MMDRTEYWTIGENHAIEFTKRFYDLGLSRKYALLGELPEIVLAHPTSHERIVQAILQHSSPDTKKAYPCKRERKLSKIAREQDEAAQKELINH